MWRILILVSVVLLSGCSFKYVSTEAYYTDPSTGGVFTFELDPLYDAITTAACAGDTAGDSFRCLFFVALVDQLREDTTGQIPSPTNPLAIDTKILAGFRGLHIGRVPIIPAIEKERTVRVVVK